MKGQGKLRLAWDLLIIACAVYQSLAIPLSISFEPDVFNEPAMRTLDSFIVLVYITDILIRFRSTYIDTISGEEIVDSYLISMKYLFSLQFVIDVISTLPLDDLSGGGDARAYLQVLGLLKLLRIWRIGTVIMNLNVS